MKKILYSPEVLESRIAPATFTVTSLADSGAGTFRQAIINANAAAGADVISFSFAAGSFPTIAPVSELPTITGDLVINAELTAGGAPEVVLDGFFAGPTAAGLHILGSNVTVKGLVINNFASHGIRVSGSNNQIVNNYIGTDATGTADLGNGGDGIIIEGGTANIVGTATFNNLISGNTGTGVHLAFGSTATTVMKNRIGVNGAGSGVIANLNGVVIDGDSAQNVVEGNLISGNTDYGVKVSSTAPGSTSAPSQFIRGNFIGTGTNGLGDLGNGKSGVLINSSHAVRVGGTTAGEGNIISGNNTYGVEIISGDRNQLYGNSIGLDSTGNVALGNSQTGVLVNGSNLNLIGSTATAGRNFISGNGLHGVNLLAGGSSNTIINTFIGTNKAGTAALGNAGDGIRIQSVSDTTIGGGGTNAGNVISGNTGDGVFVNGGTNAAGTTLKQNLIGTSAAGTGDLGNGGNGIQFSNVVGVATIGSSGSGSGNVIAGNSLSGILIGTADATTIQNNTIGRSDAPNTRGILINATSGNGVTVGGITAGQGNNIGFNTSAGVAVTGSANATIRGNSIHDNGGIGIDLGNNGPTANDTNDADSGANGLLNTPVITSASPNGSATVVTGTYSGLANTTLAIDFYSNGTTGQAETYVGTVSVTTDAGGTANFSQTLATVPFARSISATATRTLSPGQTSEVSAGVAQTVGMSISDAMLVEGSSGSTNLVFTVSLGSAAASNVTVNYSTANGTASAGTDYTTTAGSLTFTPGQTTHTVSIPVSGDTAIEADETFFVNLSNISGATFIDSQGVGTITNDDLASISIADVSMAEGNSGTSLMVFTVSLSAAATAPVTVNYNTANGTATAGTDYTATTGTLTFNPGQTTLTVSVPISGDAEVELDETLLLNLSNPSGASLLVSQAVGTITNDDVATISIGDASVVEGNSGNALLVFTVSLSGTATGPVSVTYTTANGTATAGTDYAATTGTLTFTPGQTSLTVSVPVSGDTGIELDETLLVNLSNASGAGISDSQAVGTITNDDFANLSIDDVSIMEGTSGTSLMVFTVSLSGTAAAPVTVSYSTANGTAVAGTDYTATTGSLTFAPGQTSLTVSVPILGDTEVELGETFLVNLSNAAGGTILDSQGVGTITNDDVANVTINDVSIVEGNSGSALMVFTVSLSTTSAAPITVNYSTADGSATAGSDYTATTGTLTFTPGQTSLTISVPVSGDTSSELDETFLLNLSNASGATLLDSQGVGTITNDDIASVTINDVSMAEGDSGTAFMVFTVSLAGASAIPVTVSYATADGTATAGTDYTATAGTLTFTPGQTSLTIAVPISGDVDIEANDTFFVNLSNVSGGTLLDSQGLGTITDDDTATMSINDVSLVEGNSGSSLVVFTVSLSKTSATPVTVNYATAGGTATAGTDYTATTGTLTFTPGQTSLTVSVPISGDTTIELDETFFVNLSAASGATLLDAQGVGTITNDDLANITIDDVSLVEGNSGSSLMVFTVSLSAAAVAPVTVTYTTADGTATAGTDYTTTTGTLTFTPGQTSLTVSVPISGDTTIELDKTLLLNLSAATGATLLDSQGVGTITNDDLATISIDDVSAPEGDAGSAFRTFTVSLSAAAAAPVSVTYSTVNGTATAGIDYASTTGILTFTPGQTSLTIAVPVFGDTDVEAHETFFVNLSSASGATLLDSQGLGTLTDDDTASVSVNDVSFQEGISGTASMVFTISLSKTSTIPVTVSYATADGTATAGTDYTAATGTLTFTPGQTSLTVSVPVLGDAVVEANETFLINLSGLSGGLPLDMQGVGTITNDDVANVTINDMSIVEGNSGSSLMVFTVTLSTTSATPITVNFATADGTANAGPDYTTTTGTLTFAPGQTTLTISVPVLGDTVVEPSETLFVNLSNPSGATLVDSQGLGTTTDDDFANITISDATMAEGNSGTSLMVFTVTLSTTSATPITVNYATANGTAVAGSDYTATTGTLTFAPGQNSRTISVPVVGNAVIEFDEAFFVNLSSASGATLADSQGLGAITNDDFAIISIGDVSIVEGLSGSTLMVFTVSLSAAALTPVSVNYDTADDTAQVGTDYTATNGTLTIPTGQTSAQISVPIIGDNVVEASERLKVLLSNASGGVIGTSQGIGTITNDDGTTIAISDVTLTEGNSGSTNAVFTVTLSAPSASPVSFNYATVNGSATTSDYTPTSGTLTFAANQTSLTITVPVLGDTSIENTENFFVNLNNPVGASIADGQGVVTILNDDLPVLSVAAISALEGNSATTFTFTVSLSPVSPFPVSVDYATIAGTALSGLDYTGATGTLTIPAGQASGSISITVLGESLIESNETFSLQLSAPVSATIGTGTAIATILNDDATTISVGGTSLAEGNAGVSNATFTVSLTAPSASDITFDFTTREGTATAGSDFSTTSGTRTIPAGATSVQITVPVVGDTLLSDDEAFFLDISNAVGATLGTASGQAQIQNDDGSVSLSITDVSHTESNAGSKAFTFTVQLSGGLEKDITVPYSTQSGTAIAGLDFTSASGTATIAAGSTSTNITVNVSGDFLAESSEAFSLVLGAVSGAPAGFSVLDGTGTGTILNDDFTISITGGSFSESSNYELTFTLSVPSADAITFDYATRGDTATSGVDFAPRTGTVTFQPGETSTTLQFPFISDSIQEANERFFVDLSNTTASIATGTAEIIILDDDAPTVSIIAGAPVVNLEDSADDAGRIPFVVFLDQPGLFPITVRIKSTPGTAGSADFVAIDQLITFAPGSVLFESEVVLLADRFAEANEQFTLALSDITNANPGTASMNAVIYDNDGLRISKSRLSATWRDLDGDLVTLTTTKPILKPELFSFRFGAPIGTAQEIAGQLLEALDLRSLGKAAEGVSLLFTSKLKDGLGDRHVNVGAIEAQGVRLGDVTVPGDLGKIDTGITLQPGQSASKLGVGLKTLTLRSLGVFGTTTQAAGGNLNSQIAGKIGAVKIAGDFADARLNATAGTGTLSIGGSLVGGANTGIYAGFKSITVKGDVLGTAPGSAVVISSETKQITIGGRVENAQIQSGVIDALKVSKGWVASSISASSIASIIIGGQVSGTAAIGDSYVFSASVIGRMTVAGEKVPLTKGPDNLLIGNTGDVRVRDLH